MSKDVDSGYAWVVFLSSYVGYAIMGGNFYFRGFIVQAMVKDYGWDLPSVTLIASMFGVTICLGGLVTGWLVSRTSNRIVTMTGGLIITIGYISCVLAQTVQIMTINFTLIGMGCSLMSTPTISILSFYFKRYLNIVSGISSSGGGVGTLLFPLIFQYCHEKYALRGTFFILAGICAHVCLIGALCRPNQVEIEAHKKYRSNKNKICNFEILKNIPLLIFAFSIFCLNTGLSTIFIFLPMYCDYYGSTAEETALVFVVIGVANILSRILTGIATNADNINDMTLYIGSFGLAGIMTILLPFYGQNPVGQMIFGIFFSLYTGGVYAILNSVNIKLVGIERVSMVTGLELFFRGGGILVGPLVGAAIDSSLHSMDSIFIFSGATFLVTSACGILMVLMKSPQNVQKVQVVEVTHRLMFMDAENKEPVNKEDEDSDSVGDVRFPGLVDGIGDVISGRMTSLPVKN